MAIRINNGTAPRAGRLTMPKGTFLSNPSTAADGALGAGGGLNPPTPVLQYDQPIGPQPNLGTLPVNPINPLQTQGLNPLSVFGRWIQGIDQSMKDEYNKTVDMAQNFDYEKAKQQYGPFMANIASAYFSAMNSVVQPQTEQTNAFKTPPNSQKNTLVGADISSSPEFMSAQQVKQLTFGMPNERISEFMQAKGYVRSYQAGVGEVWIKAGDGNPAAAASALQGSIDERGRAEYVDPTMLERGERATDQRGVTFVGGADYTDAGGNTVSQYALTLPDNIGEDKHGNYKWVSSVKKDQDGNWVRVYRRQLRKVRTRSGRRKIAERTNPQPEQQQQQSANFEQLVSLRVNFG